MKKNYLISVRGDVYNDLKIRDIRMSSSNPNEAFQKFIKANNFKSGTMVYLKETRPNSVTIQSLMV